MNKRVIIAAGGTGGHLFPAQALAEELKEMLPGCEILFLAKGLRTNPRFNNSQYPFHDIRANQIAIRPYTLMKACVNIPLGVLQSLKAMRQFAPDLVVGFGSYHTFPVLCAASLLDIPMVLHVADCVPGRVNRLFSKKAVLTGVFFPEAENALKGTVCRTTIPLRSQFYAPSKPSKEEAIVRYGLSEHKKTVLIFGGSQGAQKLNQLASQAICLTKLQVLHFTGSSTIQEELQELYARRGIAAVVRAFEPEMQYAWAAADLAIARAGASTIAEQMAFGVPSILVPYPYAMDQHQDKNAKYIEETVEGARRLVEDGLTPERLAKEIHGILEERTYQRMVNNIRKAHAQIEEFQFSKQIVNILRGQHND
jgi:UDP-N-acetylglucosamine--N-acetylmuramyl-(pentapeptide) pyrophosphoryl-undecaprenol N-acetylglucosamine transferase